MARKPFNAETYLKGKRAALYARMSSQPQDHSIEHQCARLYEYADQHGIEVVKVYTDPGKSGLHIENRPGMLALITDVQGRNAQFELVLVYDVSRWGRFQDPDEGAHYEFICKDAHIPVIYCAEQFDNDGSALAVMAKGFARFKAAEDSRVLSEKVFAAQCRFAAKGYKMGGYAGFALRRISFDKDGKKRRILKSGERKAALTDRVRLCWGPIAEVQMVRQIYAWYLQDNFNDTKIAALLNERKVKSTTGRAWTPALVKTILTNPKYAGRAVFNRGSSKLSAPRELNAPAEWINAEVVAPMVTPETFEQALAERERRTMDKDRETLIGMLKSLYATHGKVTVGIINAAPDVPSAKYFSARFGTLAEAYQAAGLPAAEPLLRARTLRAVRQMREATMSAIKLAIEAAGATQAHAGHDYLLQINSEVILKVAVARSRHDSAGHIRWRIPIHTPPVPDFVLCVQMDSANVGVMGYYLFPVAHFTQSHIILRAEFPQDRDAYRYPTLAAIFGCRTSPPASS
jgi:DNA invertase Pin-like site-specific DNA recombinase